MGVTPASMLPKKKKKEIKKTKSRGLDRISKAARFTDGTKSLERREQSYLGRYSASNTSVRDFSRVSSNKSPCLDKSRFFSFFSAREIKHCLPKTMRIHQVRRVPRFYKKCTRFVCKFSNDDQNLKDSLETSLNRDSSALRKI